MQVKFKREGRNFSSVLPGGHFVLQGVKYLKFVRGVEGANAVSLDAGVPAKFEQDKLVDNEEPGTVSLGSLNVGEFFEFDGQIGVHVPGGEASAGAMIVYIGGAGKLELGANTQVRRIKTLEGVTE